MEPHFPPVPYRKVPTNDRTSSRITFTQNTGTLNLAEATVCHFIVIICLVNRFAQHKQSELVR